MKTSLIFQISVLIAFFSVVQMVAAVPAAPSPTCEIVAKVLGIESKSAKTMAGVFYMVSSQISEISTYKQEGTGSCDDSYLKNAEEAGQILTLTEYGKTRVRDGQNIKAKIHFGGDEQLGGFFLSDVQLLEDATKQATPGVDYRPYVILGIVLLAGWCIFFKRRRKT